MRYFYKHNFSFAIAIRRCFRHNCDMENANTLAERVRLARKIRGLSQVDLARKLKTGQSTVASIENGRNKGSGYLVHIAAALGVNSIWLATGRGEMEISNWAEEKDRRLRSMGVETRRLPVDIGQGLAALNQPEPTEPVDNGIQLWDSPEDLPPDPSRVWVDRFDLICSAGGGAVQWEVRQKDALPFTRNFFRAIGCRPEACKLVNVRGDSMEPFLFDKDMMMIDTTRTQIRDGAVYAVCFEGEMLVKQIFKQSGGALTLHSYNARYPDRMVQANEATNFEILGQVVYRSGSGLPGL